MKKVNVEDFDLFVDDITDLLEVSYELTRVLTERVTRIEVIIDQLVVVNELQNRNIDLLIDEVKYLGADKEESL